MIPFYVDPIAPSLLPVVDVHLGWLAAVALVGVICVVALVARAAHRERASGAGRQRASRPGVAPTSAAGRMCDAA